ncbi:hypothetical protein DACRYDRAFT_24151 [Dacryopinax primogenitus]|uniref:F-box domain-containing protein n=1 Tax=Dacryopinax primogenitus (strain DJM 731) TaxID=1858805 RepID=M5FSY7_DACPD|nr:uncharacterized protein DACRYDRAFT_24151 [Dacryopinax primogenitus]EJT99083.1 hypothetical protein DACRYDRAFT_24151 [Dacryopinax primogenitus]
MVSDGGGLLLSLAKVLSRCPRLIRLHISQYDAPTTLPVSLTPFWETRMPHLQTLTLDRVACHELTPDFLYAHSQLENVVLWDESPLSVIPRAFLPDVLPNIRSLRMRCARVEAYLELVCPLSDGRRRPLRELRIWVDPFLASIQQSTIALTFCRAVRGLATLRRVEIAARSMGARAATAVALLGPALPQVTDVAVHPLHESEEAIVRPSFHPSTPSSSLSRPAPCKLMKPRKIGSTPSPPSPLSSPSTASPSNSPKTRASSYSPN